MSLSPSLRWLRPALISVVSSLALGAPPAASAAETSCQPMKPRELQLIVAEAEDFLATGAVSDSIDSVSRGEAMLACLADAVAPSDLGDLLLIKGAAWYRLGSKGRKEAERAFETAFVVYPEASCDVPGINSSGKSTCEKIGERVESAGEQDFRLTGHHSSALVYVDGLRRKATGRGEIQLQLRPGTHWIQVQGADAFLTETFTVGPGSSELALARFIGEPPPEVEAPTRGSLRLEGLPSDARVVVDGRERRDLPILTQLDPGDHYVKVSSSSTGVMGFTVSVNAGEETVYAVVFDAGPERRGGGGGSLGAIVSFGAAGLSAVAAGGSFVLAGLSYGRADAAFKEYDDMRDPSIDPQDISAKWTEADELQDAGDRWQILGLGLGGAAILAGGAGAVLLLTGRESTASRPLKVLPVAAADGSGFALMVRGTF